MPNRQRVRPGQHVIFKARVVQPTVNGELIIETFDHRQVTIHESMIVSVESEICVDMTVESTKPNMEGVRGVVKAIDGRDAFVRWASENNPNGVPSIEPVATLIPIRLSPQ